MNNLIGARIRISVSWGERASTDMVKNFPLDNRAGLLNFQQG